MSDNQDKAFMGTFAVVIGLLVVIAAVFFLAAQYASSANDKEETDPRLAKAIDERIEPIGRVAIAGVDGPAAPKPGAAPAGPKSGKDIVAEVCASCHNAGVLGAPKIGTKDEWTGRVAAGWDTLMSNAINGKGSMPPRGGGNLTDDEVKNAVIYMLEQSDVAVPAEAGGQAAAPAAEAAPEMAADGSAQGGAADTAGKSV